MNKPSLVVVGASGFLGRAVLDASHPGIKAKAIARRPPVTREMRSHIGWFSADVAKAGSLKAILEPDDIVLNLIYDANATKDENLAILDHLIGACIESGVSRFVHCSTAVVVGASREQRITAETPCVPITPYERCKQALEQRMGTAIQAGIDVGILRPTAIVGPGSQNLLKLANTLFSASPLTTYLQASLFGKRPMHLVPVKNVAAALVHLATLDEPLDGRVFIAASDDDPINNFKSVESQLLETMQLPPRRLPLLPVPAWILSVALRLLGRSDHDMSRRYDSRALSDTGFEPPDNLASAIAAFAQDFTRTRNSRLLQDQ